MAGIMLQEVINRVDLLKPNAYESETKTDWVNRVEAMIQSELMGETEIISYIWDNDADKELLAKAPYCDIYENYIMAMIDYTNNDISSYSNSMAIFNTAYDEYAKAYRRENPTSITKIKNYW